jgi:hypothetical protein
MLFSPSFDGCLRMNAILDLYMFTSVIMKNQCLAILLLVLLANATNAQKAFNNSVKINMGGFHIKDRHMGFAIDRQLGASYDRQIYKGFGAGMTYGQWGIFSPTSFTLSWGKHIPYGNHYSLAILPMVRYMSEVIIEI